MMTNSLIFLCPGIKGKEKFFQTLVSQNVHFTNISFFSVWIITFRGWSEQVKIVHVWLHIIIQFHIRSPRIFAVTTTTSLSTFNTQTLCYSQSDPAVPLTACAARRKRMLSARRSNIDNDNDGVDGEINPSNTEEEDYDYGLGNWGNKLK